MNRFVLDFTRSNRADEGSVELSQGDQEYQIRAQGQSRPDLAELRWSERLLEQLSSLREHSEAGVRETAARIGRTLANFVNVPGWKQPSDDIAARADQSPTALSIRSNASEIYLLPWELLSVGSITHAAFLSKLLIRYEWPDTRTAAPPAELSRTKRGRVIFAWSAAGGKVDAARHVRLIERAIDAGASLFDESPDRAFDVIENASCESLRACLERARAANEPVAVLHLLCHGGADIDGNFGLALSGSGDPGAKDLVSASRLQQLLLGYTGLVRLVVISACDGGNAGHVEHALGSVAQNLHRAGFGAVIASRLPLSWDGARLFATELYDKLARDLAPLEEAFLAARARLSREASYDWASLQLYARESDGDATYVFNARPYRGLSAFAPEHARFFFGREREIEELTRDFDLLVEQSKPRFLVVAGASGTGKSSMVMAGAIPRWSRTVTDGRFVHVVVRPGAAPGEALKLARERIATSAACLRFLVVVDQFEELFTHGDIAAATDFTRTLWEWATDPDSIVCVILTLRVDFLSRCSEVVLDAGSGLRLDKIACDGAHQVLVAQMDPDQLRAAIERPALVAGLALEPGLADVIVHDVGAEPGALPLMSHALYLLWLGRTGRVLTRGAYQALGSVQGALNAHAEKVLAGLADDAEREAARRLMVRLVRPGTGGEPDTRRRRAVSELWPDGEAERARFDRVLEGLVNARLLVTGGGEGGKRTVEIAHETLIRNWKRLKDWIEAERTRIVQFDKLDAWVREWKERPEELLTGSKLGYANEVAAQSWSDLGPDARALIERSREARTRQQEEAERSARVLRRTRNIAVATAAVACGIAAVAVSLRRQAVEERDNARRAQREREEARQQTQQAHAATQEARTETALRGIQQSPDPLEDKLAKALRIRSETRGAGAQAPGVGEVLFDLTAAVRERTRLRDYQGALRVATFSRDGTRVFAAFEDDTYGAWDAVTGERIVTGRGRVSSSTPDAFTRDVSRLVAPCEGAAACVWDLAPTAGEAPIPRVLTGHAGLVNHAVFSHDGARILTASARDRSARVWDAATGRALFTMSAYGAEIRHVALSADGAFAAVASDLRAHLVELPASDASGATPVDVSARARVISAVGGTLRGVGFSSTEDRPRFFMAYSNGVARFVNAHDGASGVSVRDTSGAAHGGISSASLSRDGDRALTVFGDGLTRVWTVTPQSGGTLLCNLLPEETGSSPSRAGRRRVDAALSRNGERVITITEGRARVWSVEGGGRPLATLQEPGSAVRSASFLDDAGDRVRFLATSNSGASVWNTNDVDLVDTLWVDRGPAPSVSLSPDGTHFITVSRETIELREVRAGLGPAQRFPQAPYVNLGAEVEAAGFSADGRRVVAALENGTVHLWNWSTVVLGRRKALLENTGRLRAVTARVAPDGTPLAIAAATRDDRVIVWKLGANAPQELALGYHAGEVYTVAFSASGDHVLTASADGTACVWNVSAPPDTSTAIPYAASCNGINLHDGIHAVLSAAFSPNGTLVVTTHTDGLARLWNLRAEPPRPVPLNPGGALTPVYTATFSPDGARLITAYGDGTFRIWRTSDGWPMATIPGHSGAVTHVAFSGAGDRESVTTLSEHGVARIWHIAPAPVAHAACDFLRHAQNSPDARGACPEAR